MAVKTKEVRNDLIPMKSGIVRVTPYDKNFRPLYAEAITTTRDFLTSTQIVTTRTSETLANGNGADKDFPVDERHTLALVTNAFDPKFHNALANRDVVVEAKIRPQLYDTTIKVEKLGSDPAFTYEYTFTGDEIPVKMDDDVVYLEIRDSFGNLFIDISNAEPTVTLGEGNYKYDPDTHKISFDAQYDNISLFAVYHREVKTATEAYASKPTLASKTFMVEIFAELMSASTSEQIDYYAIIERANVTGDLPNVTSQKSRTSTLTYNFTSAPVPKGVSAFYDSFTTVEALPTP